MLSWCRRRESKLIAKWRDYIIKCAICIRDTPQNTPLAKLRLPNHKEGLIGLTVGAAALHGVQGVASSNLAVPTKLNQYVRFHLFAR